MKRRWWILIPLALIGMLYGGVRYARKQARAKESMATAAYTPVKVARGSLSVTVDASGTVVSDSAADIYPSRDGEVTAVLVKPGDPVKAGQVLARMDATDTEAQLRQARDALAVAQVRLRSARESSALSPSQAQMEVDRARAGVASAKAKLDQLKAAPKEEDVTQAESSVNQAQLAYDAAKSNYERKKRLFDEVQGVTSLELEEALNKLQNSTESLNSAKARLKQAREPAAPEDVASAEASLAQAQASLAIAEANQRTAGQSDQVLAAEADLRKAQDNLVTARRNAEGMTLVAPFAGVVTQVSANVGTNYVSSKAGNPLVSMASPGHLIAEVEVNENDIIQVKVGQEAIITMDAIPNGEFHGKVITVGGLGHTTGGVVCFTVRVAVTDASPDVKPGMTADATIMVVNRPDALSVPNSAIETRMGRTVARIYQANGEVGYRRVTTGMRTETMTEIIDGLRAGESVAVPAVKADTNQGTETRRQGGGMFGPMGIRR